MAVLLADLQRKRDKAAQGLTKQAGMTMKRLLHESMTGDTPLLLMEAMAVGMLTGDTVKATMQPFTGDLFKNMLAFSLLDTGLLAARNVGGLKGKSA